MNAIQDDEVYFNALRSAGLILGLGSTFVGVGLGLRESVIGICLSAECKPDLSLTIVPFAFITASIIYSLIIFFMVRNVQINNYEAAFKFLTATLISGIGGFCSSWANGGIARYACVTKSKQKKFTTQFFLMMIFAELIALFALIMTIAYAPKTS
ncbi:hypothetical protein EDEG_03365 [Edhazardia aedis USNM 41457]|uniref:V-ATPase proteolipid subunit C-like domain-containing protein n=1 Tax=Edhazardia aedis (strain USNM 41457) TaxID=1003232 RepID=J9D3S1_EDHAE|nr:hypothetical protein EDEG_03365 [Edhazardia aedis USNM 41457]|eukprot:EJW02189.1 hypothetical protein EDEG_03365 [Edhazardia aedis USNM 41457]